MENEAISIPIESVQSDTSSTVMPAQLEDTNADTIINKAKTEEPSNVENIAEIENPKEPEEQKEAQKLYAGKYKDPESLEKAYKEAEPYVTKAAELEKKLKEQENSRQALSLEEARANGYNSAEEAEIHSKIKIAEFEHYANNLVNLDSESMEAARAALINYYQTGNKDYFNVVKSYFDDDFIEQTAIVKEKMRSQLNSEFEEKKLQDTQKAREELIQLLEENNKEFLADIEENQPKIAALAPMFKLGLINSQGDMEAFIAMHNAIGKQAVSDYLKQQEAKKEIEDTKGKASVPTGQSSATYVGSDKCPTYAEIKTMSQKQYNEATKKFGIENILRAQ